MEKVKNQAEALCARLTGHEACHQLISRMCRQFSQGRFDAFLKEWSDREDVLLTLPWGSYRGSNGLVRFAKEETIEDRRGILNLHCALTECLEVAADGQSARGCWMFQSITTTPDGACNWLWYKADVYLAPDSSGAWKIWQMTVYPMYNSPFDSDWGKEKEPDWNAIGAKHQPDEPATEKPWHLGDPVRLWECYPPKTYETWNASVMGREPK